MTSQPSESPISDGHRTAISLTAAFSHVQTIGQHPTWSRSAGRLLAAIASDLMRIQQGLPPQVLQRLLDAGPTKPDSAPSGTSTEPTTPTPG